MPHGSKKRVLITGASGFSAKFLLRLLSQDLRNEIYGLDRRASDFSSFYLCDLGDAGAAKKAIGTIKPDQIYHLAGSFTNDYETDYRANVLATKNIFDALDSNVPARVLLVGSAAEYGMISEADNPVPEHHPLKPVSVYGLTKMFQTHLMDYYCGTRGLDAVMARTFNLWGPGASNLLFAGRLFEQIEKYKRKELPYIAVGNLDAERDYIGVEEAVSDYAVIMNHGVEGSIYHVASGKAMKMSELLKNALAEAGLGMNVVRQETVKKQIDVPVIYADTKKINALKHSAI